MMLLRLLIVGLTLVCLFYSSVAGKATTTPKPGATTELPYTGHPGTDGVDMKDCYYWYETPPTVKTTEAPTPPGTSSDGRMDDADRTNDENWKPAFNAEIRPMKLVSSHEECIHYCQFEPDSVRGFKYAAVANGSKCYCGNKGYDKYGLATMADCSSPCENGIDKYCGKENTAMLLVVSYELGCYSKKISISKPLPQLSTTSDFRCAHRCQKNCTNSVKKLRFAGVTTIDTKAFCYCSENLRSENQIVLKSACSNQCPGDKDRKCGSVGYSMVRLAYHVNECRYFNVTCKENKVCYDLLGDYKCAGRSEPRPPKKSSEGLSTGEIIGIVIAVIIIILLIILLILGILFYIFRYRPAHQPA